MAAVKKALAKTKSPEKKRALVAQLKAIKRVVALRKALSKAPLAKKAAILAKIVKARAAVKKAASKVVKVNLKIDAKKLEKSKLRSLPPLIPRERRL